MGVFGLRPGSSTMFPGSQGGYNSGVIVNIQESDRLWKLEYLDVNIHFVMMKFPLFLLS